MTQPTLSFFGNEFAFQPAQMQALNPLMVMILIPFNNMLLFPLIARMGIEVTALRRMSAGIAFTALAWIVIGIIQSAMDSGTPTSMAWQILPYAILTLGEVLVSATGLEFAYSQAPPSMKGTIMSLWYLAITVGSLWVLIVNASVKHDAVLEYIRHSGMGVIAFQMYFFAAFAFAAAVVFGWYATRYRMTNNYRA